MRAAVLQLPGARTASQNRLLLRAAIRQLERAELYFDAVAAMQINDREVRRALDRMKAETRALRGYLGEQGSALLP